MKSMFEQLMEGVRADSEKKKIPAEDTEATVALANAINACILTLHGRNHHPSEIHQIIQSVTVAASMASLIDVAPMPAEDMGGKDEQV